MTADKLYTSLSAIYTIMAKLTIHFQQTRLIAPSTDKHYLLDSEEDFSSGRRNVNQQQQFFSEIPWTTTTDLSCSSYLRLLDDAFHGKGISWISLHGTTQELISRAQVVMDIFHGVWTFCTRVWSWVTLSFDFDRLIIIANKNKIIVTCMSVKTTLIIIIMIWIVFVAEITHALIWLANSKSFSRNACR